ncbi:hypothetical protein CP557_01970 [Natrinema ejinorense]|uniref:Uncharacterized protein n=1 Tax=Natrinema ejinorense TaxID=373386 RepID=A0A2A5QRD7_9EURY|nr:hypothetical protein CP557_01970 [Natrinema ejinorense]
MPNGEIERTLAACRTCDSVYASRKWSDGTIQPIGRPGCQCGSTQFRTIKNTGTPVIPEKKIK